MEVNWRLTKVNEPTGRGQAAGALFVGMRSLLTVTLWQSSYESSSLNFLFLRGEIAFVGYGLFWNLHPSYGCDQDWMGRGGA